MYARGFQLDFNFVVVVVATRLLSRYTAGAFVRTIMRLPRGVRRTVYREWIKVHSAGKCFPMNAAFIGCWGETLNLRLLSERVNDLIAIIYVCSTFGVGGVERRIGALFGQIFDGYQKRARLFVCVCVFMCACV